MSTAVLWSCVERSWRSGTVTISAPKSLCNSAFPVGVSGSGPLTMRTQRRPSRAAAAAVTRQWLDWGPPAVMRQVIPSSLSGASSNSSLRTLLPPRPKPVSESSFTRRSSAGLPSASARRASGRIGVGRFANLSRDHSESLVSAVEEAMTHPFA